MITSQEYFVRWWVIVIRCQVQHARGQVLGDIMSEVG